MADGINVPWNLAQQDVPAFKTPDIAGQVQGAFSQAQAGQRAQNADNRIDEDRTTAKAAGALYATGDFQGAQNRLATGGQLDAANTLDMNQYAKMGRALTAQGHFGGLLADTQNEAEWNTLKSQAQANGVDVSSYEGMPWDKARDTARMKNAYKGQMLSQQLESAKVDEQRAKAMKEDPVLGQALKRNSMRSLGIDVPSDQVDDYANGVMNRQAGAGGATSTPAQPSVTPSQPTGVPGVQFGQMPAGTPKLPASTTPPGSPTAIGGAIAPGRGERKPILTDADKTTLALDAAGFHPDVVNTLNAYPKAKAAADAKRDSDFEMKQVTGGQIVSVLDGIKQTLASAPPEVAEAAIGPINNNDYLQALRARGTSTSVYAQARELHVRLNHQLALLENAARGAGGSDQSQKIAGEAAGKFMSSGNLKDAMTILDDAREGFAMLHGLPTKDRPSAYANSTTPKAGANTGEAKPYAGPGQLTPNKDGSYNWTPGSNATAAQPRQEPTAEPAKPAEPPGPVLRPGSVADRAYNYFMSPRDQLNAKRAEKGLPAFTGSTNAGTP